MTMPMPICSSCNFNFTSITQLLEKRWNELLKHDMSEQEMKRLWGIYLDEFIPKENYCCKSRFLGFFWGPRTLEIIPSKM